MAKKAHFIGIAGKGMSATALLLRDMGWAVSGSDEGAYPPVSTYLDHAGIQYARSYKKENIPQDADVVVVGKNARLTRETNEEVRAAYESGIPVRSFPDMLEELTRGKDAVVVAGSYGKSTTAALLAWCLTEAGKDPSYFIGEIVNGFSAHARTGASHTFVLEGDEYPSSNWDETAKFLHYNARNVLLTSATHDHVNVYPTHEEYLAPFRALIASLPEDGLLVANTGERFARELAKERGGRTVFYSLDDAAHWHAANISYGAETSFDLMRGSEKIIALRTSLLGEHNIENIVGASAMLLEKQLVSAEELARGIATFQGVKRRMELLSPASRVPVIEGFGSSYEKARSAIAAMRRHYPDRRLLMAFEPNTIGWRSRANLAQYDTAFEGAQEVVVLEAPHDGKETELSLDEIVERVRASGIPVRGAHGAEDVLAFLKRELKSSDAVLLLSSGAMDGLTSSVPRLAEKLFPA